MKCKQCGRALDNLHYVSFVGNVYCSWMCFVKHKEEQLEKAKTDKQAPSQKPITDQWNTFSGVREWYSECD